MNKFLITLTLVGVFGYAQAQIPNPEMEDWTIDTLFEQPTGFTTSNAFGGPEDGGPTVTKVANDMGGFSARAESNENQTGIVFAGTVGDDDDFGPGLPYSMSPDTLFIRNKRSVSSEDSAFAIIIFFVNGTAIGFEQFLFTDTVEEYTVDTFMIGNLLVDPDSIFIGFTSGNPDEATAGNWVEVDYFRFNTSEAIPNGEFEEWDVVALENPNEYFTTNGFTFNDGPSVIKSDDAHSGEYAMLVETKILGDPSDEEYIGAAVTGVPAENGVNGGFPVDSLPDALTGYFKYAPQNGDSAEVTIIFKKWNGVQADFVAFGSIRLPASPVYAPFSVPINFGPIPPEVDSAIIFISSSMGVFDFNDEGDEEPQLGSKLWIDSLSFSSLPNAAPFAGNDELTVDAGSSDFVNVLENDIDFDGELDPLTVAIVDSPMIGTVTLEATGEATYQSTSSSGDDMFTYTVNDAEGLTSNVATVFVTVSGSVGVNNRLVGNSSIYPNPVKNNMTIEIPGSGFNGAALLTITDVTGKAHTIETSIVGGKALVNLGDLSSGLYGYNLVVNGKSYSGKFSKQ